jgi:hypothetical protein
VNGKVITDLSSVLSSFRSSASQASANCVIGSNALPSWSLQAVSICPSMRWERSTSMLVRRVTRYSVMRLKHLICPLPG